DKPIIERGLIRSILHNNATALKSQLKSTGNAGWVYPRPWNLEISEGELREEEIPSVIRNGVIITNNWYTRLQNYYEGYFSTVSRDAALLVRNGEIEGHVGKVRIATSFPRLLSSIVGASRSRHDVSWWEVRVPTRAPFLLVENTPLTKPEA
ncbi:MAG: metallopeptidase TldD-related protein, partial [Desulfurococcaceae archaeon]